MKTLLINGNPQGGAAAFNDALGQLAETLGSSGHQVVPLELRKLEIAQCVGCFTCWLKTPGLCIFKDGQEQVLRQYLAADLVVFASPLIMGSTSALLKRCCDRLIPILLPYIDVSSGECRHYLRYGTAPRLGVLYAPEPDSDAEELALAAGMWRRLARNAGSSIEFFAPLDAAATEVFPCA
jgi:multimeric flavodoxin WrbA